MDIRTVVSDLSTSELHLGVSTWNRFERRDFPRFVVLLDTTGTRRFDRLIEMLCCGDDKRFICIVYDYPSEEMLGIRAATRPTKKDLACSFPRQWFPDIHRAVRFVVFSDDGDRAPDQGRYHWL